MPVCTSVWETGRGDRVCPCVLVYGKEGGEIELGMAYCVHTLTVNQLTCRNATNLDLCLPNDMPLSSTAGLQTFKIGDAAADARRRVFPVTLLLQGEGAKYEHQFHPPPNPSHLTSKHTGIWPGAPQGSVFEAGSGSGYCAACEVCMEAQRQEAAEDDAAFGHVLSCDQRYSASRFAAPRLRALASVASLSFAAGASTRADVGENAGVDDGGSCEWGEGGRYGGQTTVRYSVVVVTEDGCQAILRDVLQQVHEHLHARLLELVAKACSYRRQNSPKNKERQRDTKRDTQREHVLADKLSCEDDGLQNAFSSGLEACADSPVQVLRLLLNSHPIAEVCIYIFMFMCAHIYMYIQTYI